MIHFLIYQMDGHTGHSNPLRQGIPHRMGPRESRQKCRMDVQDSPPIPPDKPGRKDPHKTGQHNQTNVCSVHHLGQRPIKLLPRRKPPGIHHNGRDIPLLCPENGPGRWVVANHHGNPRMEAFLLDGTEDRLEIGPLAGTADRNGRGFQGRECQPVSFWIFSSSSALGLTPTARSTSCPALKKTRVGMLSTPN